MGRRQIGESDVIRQLDTISRGSGSAIQEQQHLVLASRAVVSTDWETAPSQSDPRRQFSPGVSQASRDDRADKRFMALAKVAWARNRSRSSRRQSMMLEPGSPSSTILRFKPVSR